MTVAVDTRTAARPYRVFRVVVQATQRLSPTFLRVTFSGPDLDQFADNGFDQRVVLILPLPELGFDHLPTWENWHPTWRSLPLEHRNPLRTYTVRAVRQHQHEVDVDVVLHPHGAASRWAEAAKPGQAAALLGPDSASPQARAGVEFQRPDDTGPVLLVGDETAVPAIAAILERLPSDARGEALLEVPCAEDALDLRAPAGVRVSWLPRCGGEVGAELGLVLPSAAERLLDGPDEPYVWVAGEAAMVRHVRHHLINERELDRRCVSCRGYWRRPR